MPLDFDALFDRFRVAFHIQWKSIGESLHKVALWLTKRLKQTREREIETRGLQIFDFTGSALSLRIDNAQRGLLTPKGGAPPDEGFLASVAAPFKAFWRGLLLAPEMIEAEQTLPGIIDALSRFVDLVTASTNRFLTPEKSLFDPNSPKKWDDLFGELALFFRLVNDPATVKQVQTFSQGGIDIIDVIHKHFPSNSDEPSKGGLPELGREVLGATLAIPLVTELISNLARTIGVVVRIQLVDRSSVILKKVFELRRAAVDFVYVTAFGFGSWALEQTVIAQSDVLYSLGLYLDFAKEYVEQIQAWITGTGKDIKTLVDGYITFVKGLADYLEKFMDVDIGDAVSLGTISFHLKDILEWRDDPSKAKEVQDGIIDFIGDHPFASALIAERLAALWAVVGIAATKTVLPEEAAPPDLSELAPPPQLYEAFFGGKRADALRKSLTDLGTAIPAKVGDILDSGKQILVDLGDTMHQAADDATRIGSVATYRRIAEGAARISEAAFGADAARAAFVPKQDPIADAFASWMAVSGFKVVEKVLPAYVKEMVDFWREEVAEKSAERPTSPHIVARRTDLARVRVPRVFVEVEAGRETDKTLVVEIADRVREAVAQAFGEAAAQPALAP
jgi:hypothetical protein